MKDNTSNQNLPHDQMEWPDKNEAHNVIRVVFEHYQLHTKVVGKKLNHAQTATRKSIENVDAESAESHIATLYDTSWGKIIALFNECGLTQEELFDIEKILDTLPANIRVHFERLIELDQTLQTMMAALEKMNYEEAIKVVNTVQSRENPMSGLSQKHYEEGANTSQHKKVKAYSFIPPRKSE